VDKLVARRLVRRTPSTADRRVTMLSLTRAGRRLIAGIFPAHARLMRQAVAALSPREQTAAGALLKKLGRGAGERL